MNVFQFSNRLEFNRNNPFYQKINPSCSNMLITVINWHFKFSAKFNTSYFQLNGQCTLIDYLLETIAQRAMNSHCTPEYFSNQGTAWITPKDLSMNGDNKFITKGEIDVSDKGLKVASLKIMPKGTILLSSRAPIGYMAIAREAVTTNQGFKSFVPKTDYTTPFIFYTIKNSLPEIINNASGSTFKEISGGTLKTIKTCLPEKSIIKSFTKKVESIFERQNLIEIENQQLSEHRDWLLPMLMNGQVKV